MEWQAEHFLSVDRLEDHEVKMRLARESGLTRKPDRLTGCDFVADVHHRSARLEMMIIGKRPIGVFDHHVITKGLKLWIGPTHSRIVTHAHHAPVARRAYDCAFRNVPVDGVLPSGSLEITERPTRSLHNNVAAGAERHPVIGLV